MRALEQAAIDSGEVTGLELMERAGEGVVAAILEEWPELAKSSQRAVVLCGPGNNGGDGFVVARLLRERGWEVEVFLYGDPKKLPPDAKANSEAWLKNEVIRYLTSPDPTAEEIAELDARAAKTVGRPGPDLIVDALFGTGLSRPIDRLGRALEEIQAVGGRSTDPWWPRLVSVDVPSGLCADSGKVLGANSIAVGAHLTVTFHEKRLAHTLADGPEHCGKVACKPIGLPGWHDRRTRKAIALLHGLDPKAPKVGRFLAHLQTPKWFYEGTVERDGAHKYHHGHAVVLAGGPGRGGAARLAARGALRIGAGLVTVACPPEALTENAARLDAIMLRALDDAEALTVLLADDRLNAICLGPGLGTTHLTRNMVNAVLAADRDTVLDADALTVFADAPQTLFDQLHKRCVLTPHEGEFARLFPDIAEKLSAPATKGPAYSKLDATREAAERAGCTVLFKGPDTVISDQNGNARINSAHYDRKAPWLATAGAGDVLAGFITGLLARDQSLLEAASTAAWLHVECARSFGPGLIAEDLPEELPKVLKTLLSSSL